MDLSFFIVAFGVPLAGFSTLMAVAVIADHFSAPDWLGYLMAAAVLVIGALYLAWLIASGATSTYYTYNARDDSITMTYSWSAEQVVGECPCSMSPTILRRDAPAASSPNRSSFAHSRTSSEATTPAFTSRIERDAALHRSLRQPSQAAHRVGNSHRRDWGIRPSLTILAYARSPRSPEAAWNARSS
jgi:hypothetical protein